MSAIKVFDDLLPNFEEYKKEVEEAGFGDVVSQGQKYSDMSQDVAGDHIYEALSKRLGFDLDNKVNFLRAYVDRPEYRHPMWIHSDTLFADYICILFVQASEYKQDDGVAFWRNKQTGSIMYRGGDEEVAKIVDTQSINPDFWTITERVEFKENRLVMAPAHFFHSKASYGNYGETLDKCRIVHVLFSNRRR